MRTRAFVGAVALSLLLPLAARSQEDAEREVQLAKARQVLELSGGGTLGVQVIAQMLPALKQMAPQAPEEFWREFMAEVDPDRRVDGRRSGVGRADRQAGDREAEGGGTAVELVAGRLRTR
jgi:hypothetical protein